MSVNKSNSTKHINIVCSFYNNLFLRQFNSALTSSNFRHDVKLVLPMFYRKFTLFTLTCKILRLSKKKNINSTIWLEGSVSNTRFFFVSPRFSKSISIRAF